MLIAELFHSVQGEGRWTGTPSLFIRTSGCNLRCWFCDTPYTSWQPEGEPWTVDRLVDWTAGFDCEHVVITGGEPLLAGELPELTSRLKQRRHIITIETAGTVWQPVACDLMSISPKLANSTPRGAAWEQRHEERRRQPEVVRRLLADFGHQLKFVVDTPNDIADVEAWLRDFPAALPENVYLMPQGTDAALLREKLDWIAPAASARDWNVSRRLHIELFGNRRGV